MQNQYILKISDHSFFHHWTMYLDLFQINEDAGRKERDPLTGKMMTVYSISSVKKLFKLANQYGEETELEDVDGLIYDKCKRIAPYWEAAKRWRK